MHTYIYCTTKTKTKRKEEEDEEKDKVPEIIPAAKIPTVEHEVGTWFYWKSGAAAGGPPLR